jgi:hypothetical protein
VIVGFHHHMSVGNVDFIVAHNRADGDALWKCNFIQASTHDFGGISVTVGNNFNRFGGSTAQRVYVANVPATDMG